MAFGTVKQAILEEYQYVGRYAAAIRQVEDVVRELGLTEYPEVYINANQFGDSRILLYADPETDSDDVANLRSLVKSLLPKVGKFTKTFDREYNKFRFKTVYNKVDVEIEVSPPSTCTVETVEEEEIVPEQPFVEEHTKTVTRYKLQGDCEPVLAIPVEALEEAPETV